MRLATLVTLGNRFTHGLVDDPIEAVIDVREWLTDRSESRARNEHGTGFMPWPPCPYEEHANWEQALHQILGQPWPCPQTVEFAELWPRVIRPLESAGLTLGRGAFAGWGDGEPGFARAIWCLTRHTRPSTVVETGVARGITSRFILEALGRNGEGHLWSVDRPPPTRDDLQPQIGAAVPASLRERWSYVEGSSRRRLPALLKTLSNIDLFVHDSKHTERNLLYELNRARNAVRPGGFLAADDIDVNCGLHRYRTRYPRDSVLICPAEPLQPDPGRQSDRGIFAVIAKPAQAPN